MSIVDGAAAVRQLSKKLGRKIGERIKSTSIWRDKEARAGIGDVIVRS